MEAMLQEPPDDDRGSKQGEVEEKPTTDALALPKFGNLNAGIPRPVYASWYVIKGTELRLKLLAFCVERSAGLIGSRWAWKDDSADFPMTTERFAACVLQSFPELGALKPVELYKALTDAGRWAARNGGKYAPVGPEGTKRGFGARAMRETEMDRLRAENARLKTEIERLKTDPPEDNGIDLPS
jgi:hypothetical protein